MAEADNPLRTERANFVDVQALPNRVEVQSIDAEVCRFALRAAPTHRVEPFPLGSQQTPITPQNPLTHPNWISLN
jgi:hypothetical protein